MATMSKRFATNSTPNGEIRQLLGGGLNPQRSAELIDEMRAAGLPL